MKPKSNLSGKQILLGVSGSIAAYKAVDILRKLQDQGADVRVAMTRNATRFVSPLTFETLSGRPVLYDQFESEDATSIEHIDLTDGLDLALVAPATANIIGKAASGVADDLLSTVLMALDCPLVMAPAMNDRMYRNPVVQRNIAFLKEQGVQFIDPGTGLLACLAVGQGRLAEIDTIIDAVSFALAPKDMAGITLLVTAGPTREAIDAVRYISNPSSGKMGYSLAAAARDRGANVILISGPTQIKPPAGVAFIPVTSADEMGKAVMDHVSKADVVIMAAAVSDFKPATSSDRKIKKQGADLVIELQPTKDILATLADIPGNRMLVGFAAETDRVLENALEKLKNKNLDMIVANDLLKEGAGFGFDTNAVTIIDRAGRQTSLPVLPKREIAHSILDKIAELKAN